jgi:hypothetical protein
MQNKHSPGRKTTKEIHEPQQTLFGKWGEEEGDKGNTIEWGTCSKYTVHIYGITVMELPVLSMYADKVKKPNYIRSLI